MLLSKQFNFFINFFSKIISPPFCENCQQFLSKRTIFCNECVLKIQPVVSHYLSITNTKKIPVYAVGAYQEPLKSLVVAKSRSYRLASIYLAQLIYDRTFFRDLPCDMIVPVPLHWSRVFRRGYNQSEVMAQRLAKLGNMQVADILQRKKVTKYQSGLSKIERSDNLKNAFKIKKNINFDLYKDKNLVLIDDVVTSGATLIAAAKELYTLQPKTISIVVACRAI